ncbi:hypothetical protein HC928_16065, partial [bacterium]|nr:hypothetical protein [bacterium]
YWSYLGSVSHNPDISQPFYYLKSSKFWHLVANPGYARVITDQLKLKTLADVRRVVHYAYLDEDLFDFLREPKYRQCLLEALVSGAFGGDRRHREDGSVLRAASLSAGGLRAVLSAGGFAVGRGGDAEGFQLLREQVPEVEGGSLSRDCALSAVAVVGVD